MKTIEFIITIVKHFLYIAMPIVGSVTLYKYGDTIELVGYIVTVFVCLGLDLGVLKRGGGALRRNVWVSAITLEAVYSCNRVIGYPYSLHYEIEIYFWVILYFIALIGLLIRLENRRYVVLVALALYFFPVQRIFPSLYRQYQGAALTEGDSHLDEVIFFSKIDDGKAYAVGDVYKNTKGTLVFEKAGEKYRHIDTRWMLDGSGSMDAQYSSETWWMIRLNRLFLNECLN